MTKRPLDTQGHPMPPPCPAEGIDMLPPAMWGVYWDMFPDGRQELPATVPFPLWNAQMKRMNPPKMLGPPPILKSYWGKVSSGPALIDRHKKSKTPAAPKERPTPMGPSPPVPRAFWDRYFEMFPLGHCVAAPYEPADGKPAFDEAEFKKPRYMFRGGTLCVRISGESEPFPIYRASTGCDSFDNKGNWLGPG